MVVGYRIVGAVDENKGKGVIMSVEDQLNYFRLEVQRKLTEAEKVIEKTDTSIAIMKDRLEAAEKIRLFDNGRLFDAMLADEESQQNTAQDRLPRYQDELKKLRLDKDNYQTLLAHIDAAENELKREGS
jgi:ABC-type phosphate transport system auxiliary subunit